MQLYQIKFVFGEWPVFFYEAGVNGNFTYVVQIAADFQLKAPLWRKSKYLANFIGQVGNRKRMRSGKMTSEVNDARNREREFKNIIEAENKIKRRIKEVGSKNWTVS